MPVYVCRQVCLCHSVRRHSRCLCCGRYALCNVPRWQREGPKALFLSSGVVAAKRCHSSIVKLTSFIGIKVLVNNIVIYAKGNLLLYALFLFLTSIYTVNFSIFIYSDHFFSFFLHFLQKNSGNSELSSLVPAAAELTRYGIPDRLYQLSVSNLVFSNFGVSPQFCFLKFFIMLFCSAGNTIP